MKEKKSETSVKRRNLYLIVIGAALLILTAIVIITVVAAMNSANTTIEKPDNGQIETPSDDNKEPEQPTDTEIVFSFPVQNATVKTTYSFWYNSTLNQYGLHKGIDFAADAGTEVCAAYSGTIESVTDDLLHGGKVVIDHGNGLKTSYSSIDVNSSLKVGQKVSSGDIIGTVSATTDVMGREYNEGSHLHFETVENNQYINPTAYLDIEEK